MSNPKHFFPGAAPPLTPPHNFVLHSAAFPSKGGYAEPEFDPAVHLELMAPVSVKPLIQDPPVKGDPSCQFPLDVNESPSGSAGVSGSGSGGDGSSKIPFSGLAYTEPMRILSDEGVRVVKAIVAENEKFAKSNERSPKVRSGEERSGEALRIPWRGAARS